MGTLSVALTKIRVAMKSDALPPHISHLLNEFGVINPIPKSKPIERDYTFKMPVLDDDGEPPF